MKKIHPSLVGDMMETAAIIAINLDEKLYKHTVEVRRESTVAVGILCKDIAFEFCNKYPDVEDWTPVAESQGCTDWEDLVIKFSEEFMKKEVTGSHSSDSNITSFRTPLPEVIRTKKQAKRFIRNLYLNGELFHLDDDPLDVDWTFEPSKGELKQLRLLVGDMFRIKDFDPHEVCVGMGFDNTICAGDDLDTIILKNAHKSLVRVIEEMADPLPKSRLKKIKKAIKSIQGI